MNIQKERMDAMKREAQPEDIAQIVYMLINSEYLTEENILADGGLNLL